MPLVFQKQGALLTAITSSSANPPFLAVSACPRHLNSLRFLVMVLQRPEQKHAAASESSQMTAEVQAVRCQGHVLVRKYVFRRICCFN